MKAIKDRILLAVNRTQKTDFEIELGNTGKKIWMTHGGFDKKVTGATLGQVVEDAGVYRKGEWVITHHNAFDRDITGDGRFFADDTGVRLEDGRMVFSIPLSMVFLALDKDGKATPTEKYLIGKRISKPVITVGGGLIVPDAFKESYYEDRFYVLSAHESSMFRSGDVVFTDKYGGLPVRYVFNNREIEVIRIAEEDILAMEERTDEIFPDCLDAITPDTGALAD